MYLLGAQSRAHLAGVHADMVRVVDHAIQISTQDFGVAEGVRSDADQLRDWMRHTSKLNGIPVGKIRNGVHGTGRGNHQLAADGFGHATDLVPYVNGVILWSAVPPAQQWDYIYPVAAAMHAAAIAENVDLRWGGVWDRKLRDLPGTVAGLRQSVADYCTRHPGPDFLDGPHFELVLL